ncbi:MmgE/PrpD family protein [Mesorhizobium sp.]|uniref:MmgE/PrpD family protein n=1 Tax=Mesorhizobium sp. TaxID=1871066 RepID=UPI000FE6DCBF|nr:MmgE/PrpD family protein [Mesorhizobium sp.]RWM38706.1 MAG: MmgE/PrpD family protein [Mesorhizobium sp.]
MAKPRPNFSKALSLQIEGQRFSRSLQARAIAADALADTIGCILAGSTDPVVAMACRSLGMPNLARQLVWPRNGVLRENAALVNATAAHVLEFDDHEILGVTHPSAVLVPALLALAYGSERSGRDLLDAYVAGFETINCLGRRLNPSHYDMGWHSTSTLAALGAAVSCSLLAGNSPEQTVHAFGLCCSLAGGTRAQFGSVTKPLHAGFAAHAAVRSALMARAGITAAPDAFDGHFGLSRLIAVNLEDTPQTEYAFPLIEEHGPIIKLYPSCAATHRTLDAVGDLMRSYQLTHEDIVEIMTEIPEVAASALLPGYPSDEYQARFSMSYCAAAAAERGELALEDFTSEAVSRPTIRRRAQQVRVSSYRGKGNSFAPGNYKVRTTILTQSGGVLRDERLHAKGTKDLPLSRNERLAKFENCLAKVGYQKSTSSLFEVIVSVGDLRALGSCENRFRQAGLPSPGQLSAKINSSKSRERGRGRLEC